MAGRQRGQGEVPGLKDKVISIVAAIFVALILTLTALIILWVIIKIGEDIGEGI